MVSIFLNLNIDLGLFQSLRMFGNSCDPVVRPVWLTYFNTEKCIIINEILIFIDSEVIIILE